MDQSSSAPDSADERQTSAFAASNPPPIEFCVDQSGLNRSSRDQPETRYYCPEPGCKASLKRKYDIDRHYQAKHNQSKNLFCPVKGCKCSTEPDLAFYVCGLTGAIRGGLKSKILLSRLDYCRYLFFGFHRKDKLLKHIIKYHKELAPELASLLEDKDACLEDPYVGETQAFSRRDGYVTYVRVLIRAQRKDGSWTDWSGKYRDEVAAAGFKPYVGPVALNAGSATKVNHEAYRPSPGYTGLLSQGSGSSSPAHPIVEQMQPSQGPDIQHMAAQAGYGTFPTLSADEVFANAHHPAMSLPMQHPEQMKLFPTYGQTSSWSLGSTAFPSTASSAYPNASLSASTLFDDGFMAPLQTSPPYANATGTSASVFDFSSLPPLEAISGDLFIPANGGYPSIETSQAMPENTNAGSGGECLDSFANYLLDDTVWSPPHSTSGW